MCIPKVHITTDMPSPRVNIPDEDIVYDPVAETLTIKNLKGISLCTVQNTNSAEPMIDVGHLMVRSNDPKYMDNLNVGDVIVYRMDGWVIQHSISKIGYDEEGWYCKCKGVNNLRADPWKIRKFNIEQVVLFPIWCWGEEPYKAEVGD